MSDRAEIDTFLMSCRVIGRGVEDVFLKSILDIAVARGMMSIYGCYIKTSKNTQVENFYLKRNFEIEEKLDGTDLYRLYLSNSSLINPTYFKQIVVQTEN